MPIITLGNVSPAIAAKLRHAVGVVQGLGQDADNEQVLEWFRAQGKRLVQRVEEQENEEAARAAFVPTQVDFTP